METEKLLNYFETFEGKSLIENYFSLLNEAEKPSYTDMLIRLGIANYTFADNIKFDNSKINRSDITNFLRINFF